MLLKNKFLVFVIVFFTLNLLAFEEGFAFNEDTKIAYRDYGPQTGTPILLVTGLGAQLTLWPQFLIDDLQANN